MLLLIQPKDSIVYDKPLTIEQNLTLLAAAPSRLADLTKGLSAAQLVTPPEPGEWSARDVLAHLRACADMWGGYIAVILSEDRPTFKAVNPTTWIKNTNYREQEFRPSLQAFTAQRAELLAVLKPLPPKAWSRVATVTGRASHANEPCARMPSGWQTMNNRISDRLNASSKRCAHSNEHREFFWHWQKQGIPRNSRLNSGIRGAGEPCWNADHPDHVLY